MISREYSRLTIMYLGLGENGVWRGGSALDYEVYNLLYLISNGFFNFIFIFCGWGYFIFLLVITFEGQFLGGKHLKLVKFLVGCTFEVVKLPRG